MDIFTLEVVAVGHCFTYKECYPKDWKVQKIMDWRNCKTLTEVQGFLSICGMLRIWVKDFAKHAKHLVLLMKKAVNSVWGLDQKTSMEDLKQAIITDPCLQPIDYHSD